MYIEKTKWENPALEETLFHVANGYLGLRACVEGAKQNYCRGFYINGFYDQSKITYGEKFTGYAEEKQSVCKLADVQSIALYIDGEEVMVAPENLVDYKHSLDMEKGYAERFFHLKQGEKELVLHTRRLASFHTRELALIEYSVEAGNFSGEIRLVSTLDGDVANFSASDDPRVAAMAEKPLEVLECKAGDGKLSLLMQTKHSKLQFACEVSHVQSGLVESYSHTPTCAQVEFSGRIGQGQRITLSKLIVVKDSFHFADVNIQTKLEEPAFYFAEQEAYLKGFWAKSRIVIKGNEALQNALDYSIYSLLGSVGFDDKFSVSAKGLSGEGYEGHVFWDSEIYVAPLFISTNPQIAKHLVAYRHTILPFAKEHALEMGHSKGALYPWRSIEGPECSAYFPAGSAQYHINGDIAYAIMQYFFASYDLDFLENKAFEILLETARLWLDVGHYTEKGFCIDAVTGPDEYTCIVNNNFYTNVGAQHNLKYLLYAVEVLKKEGRTAKLALTNEKELAEIAEAAEKIYLPYDKYMNLNPQDDSFLQKKRLDLDSIPKEKFPLLLHFHPLYLYRHQVCKQADVVLAHALYPESANRETKRNSFRYYEKICTHDSSLSLCAYAILAAQLGMTSLAEKYFKETVDLDINNTHKNTKDGIHTANMGGSFLVMSKGFAGVYMSEKGLSISPGKTDSIEGYAFHIEYQGSVIEIDADKIECRLRLVEGKPVTLSVYGEEKVLEDSLQFAIR